MVEPAKFEALLIDPESYRLYEQHMYEVYQGGKMPKFPHEVMGLICVRRQVRDTYKDRAWYCLIPRHIFKKAYVWPNDTEPVENKWHPVVLGGV